MDKPALLAEFHKQLEAFETFRTYIDKAQSMAERFNPTVLEKVLEDYSEKLRGVADVLDPMVGDMRGVITGLEEERDGVQDGVAQARLALEELELRHAIGELDEGSFDEQGSALRGEIESADEKVSGIESELGEFQKALDTWLDSRSDVPGVDALGGLEEEEDEDVADAGDGFDALTEDGDDLLDDEEAFDGIEGRGEGVHVEQVNVQDDVSAVFDDSEDVLEAAPADESDEDAVELIDEGSELDDLGADALVEEEGGSDTKQAVLILGEGTAEEVVYPFTSEVLSLGRGRDNNVQVKNDSKVSRYHCKLFKRNGAYFVEDNKSANGTLVDNELITEKRLHGGESIVIGETFFRFRLQ